MARTLSTLSMAILTIVAAWNSVSPVTADLFVSAASANSVMRFDETTGAFLGNFVAPGDGGLGNPQGIAFGPDGNLYVASQSSNNVLKYSGQNGAFMGVFAAVAGTSFPAEINFRNGLLYMSDFGTSASVYRFDAVTGALVDQFATAAFRADGQEWDSNGNLILSAGSNVRIHNGTSGAFMGNFVTGGIGLALDNLFLPDGTFLVSDFGTSNIKHYSASGMFLGNVITNLSGPQGLEIGPDGNLYAGSFNSGLINRYDINTFALLGTAADANGTTNNFTFGPPGQIPEPGSCAILAALAGIGFARRRHC